MTLVFALKDQPPVPIDASSWTIDRLAGLTLDTVRAEPVHLGSRVSTLGEWVRVSGTLDDQRLVIEGDCRRVRGLGSGHGCGEIIIDGDAGDLAGRGMRGGTVEIRGEAGAYAGSAMRGGVLRILKSAGDRLAGPLAGERTGMRGGVVTVGGNVGQQAGHRMRRGTIIIHDRAADGCGFEMVAGTIAAGSVAEVNLGFAMRRGTILTATAPDIQSAQYQARCFGAAYPAPRAFMSLLVASLLESAPEFRDILDVRERAGGNGCGPWQRSLGDLSVEGLGEIIYAR